MLKEIIICCGDVCTIVLIAEGLLVSLPGDSNGALATGKQYFCFSCRHVELE